MRLTIISTIATILAPITAQAQTPPPTPQDAIDFITQNVEQYGSTTCSATDRRFGNFTEKKINNIAQFTGNRALFQRIVANSGTSGSKNRNTKDRMVTISTLQFVDLASAETVSVETCRGQSATAIRLKCGSGRTCIKSDFREEMQDEGVQPEQHSSSSNVPYVDILFTSSEMAPRVIKALMFYKSTVASSPSPF